MKNMLWYQPEKLNDKDIITQNGIFLSEGKERNEVFQHIIKIANLAIKNNSPWCGKINNVFFAKGLLNAHDEMGRYLPFMFVSEEKDGISALMHELKSIGYSLTPDTEKCINKNNPKQSFLIITAISIIMITLIISLLLSHGK